MFLKMHRTKEKTEQDADEENGALVKEVENLEELVSKRALGLEETKEQLEQLSGSLDGAEEGDDKAVEADALFSSSGQPAGELAVEEGEDKAVETDTLLSSPGQPAGELAVEAKEEATSGGEAGGEEAGGEEGLEVLLTSEEEKETQESDEDDDSLSNLFSDDDEEENPLASLIKSLPDVTANELLNEAREVSVIVQDWRRR